jgi:TPR repeat protein
VFEACARDGWTGAMTWMAQLDDNGLGTAGEDPARAAEWDRMAAEAGDPVALVANVDRIRKLLDWRPQYQDLDTIVTHALTWERRLPGKIEGGAA